jgi:hypothetical protein
MSDNYPIPIPHPSSPSTWKLTLDEAVYESDQVSLIERVHAAEAAVMLRSQEIGELPEHEAERVDIHAATEQLFNIKTDRLGWPKAV